MNELVLALIHLQEQLRIAHWQTRSYALHKATAWFYEALSEHLDHLVETWQGSFGGRLELPSPCMLYLCNGEGFDPSLFRHHEQLLLGIPVSDPALLNIRDEILADLHKFGYLLSLS